MVKRIAPLRVISFVLLVACGALCQSERPSVNLLQGDGSKAHVVQHQGLSTWRLFPDAPSVQPSTQAEKVRTFVDEARSPLTLGTAGIKSGVNRETDLRHVAPGPQPSLTLSYKAGFTPQTPGTFLDKHLYPLLLKQSLCYHPSTSGSFVSRATYAASRILITRNDSGKEMINTSYFFGVLTSVAIQTAYRPYWTRSSSETFNNFGSTIGSDAGMNVFHEFGPAIRHIVKGHAPKFAYRIEERIAQDQNPTEVVSTLAK